VDVRQCQQIRVVDLAMTGYVFGITYRLQQSHVIGPKRVSGDFGDPAQKRKRGRWADGVFRESRITADPDEAGFRQRTSPEAGSLSPRKPALAKMVVNVGRPSKGYEDIRIE
jgi:hypothetical protein